MSDKHKAPEHQSPATGLAERKCVPCEGGDPPLGAREVAALRSQVPGWEVIANHQIRRAFKFPDFHRALQFVNRVGELADAEGHHPDVALSWGKAEITLLSFDAAATTEN